MMGLNKTRIEWCDYTFNPVKGLCPKACSYCYARAMYKRFKWDTEIRFEWDFTPPRKPSKIFVGSTMELFGDWIPDSWMRNILRFCSQYPEHTFLFLTKEPQNLAKFSPFPDNCFVGVTATDHEMYKKALTALGDIEAKVKYISLEPLLHRIGVKWYEPQDWGIDWLIIGAQTRPSVMPRIEWVKEIIIAAERAGIPYFMKNNLKPLLENDQSFKGWAMKQEMPN